MKVIKSEDLSTDLTLDQLFTLARLWGVTVHPGESLKDLIFRLKYAMEGAMIRAMDARWEK